MCAHIAKDVKDKLTRLKKQGNGSVNMQKVGGNEDVIRPVFQYAQLISLSLIVSLVLGRECT